MAKTVVKRGKAASSRAKKSSVRAKPKPVVAAELVRDVARRLISGRVTFAHGTTDAAAEAAFIISETLGCDPDHVAMTDRLTAPQVARIRALVGARIKTRKPAAYLLHKIYMRGVPFYIDERAIVPRSYIGEILDAHFADDAGLHDPAAVTRVLDLCTGSGCLAILAARAFPNAMIDAVELSADALDVAQRNVDAHRLGDRIKLYQGDLFEPLGAAKYDLIIANPPYVDAEGMAKLPRECLHEPPLAFDGGADGIAIIRRIIDEAAKHLNPGGGLLCEVGRCKPALEQAFPRTPFLWLDTEESEGEVFWLGTDDWAAE